MAIPKLHSRSAVFIIVCVAGLMGIGFFGILPNNKSIAELDNEISEFKNKISNQKILAPVFQNLLKRVQDKDDHNLALPEKVKISQDDIGQISSVLRALAEQHGLTLTSVVSDAASLSNEPQFVTIKLALSGDFFNLRQLLLDIETLPYLENIEELKISSDRTNKIFSMKLVLVQQ